MNKWISRCALAAVTAASLIAGTAAAQYNFVPGKDYNLVNPPQPTDGDATVEVLEFFAYGCPGCYALEPKLNAWEQKAPKDTTVKRIPTPFAIRGVDSTTIYYTLEAMGLIDKLHGKVFDAIHKDNVIIGNPEARNQWLARNGVDVKKYQEVEKSFSVDSKVKRAKALAASHRIESVPTLIVNGKYAVAFQGDRTFQVVDSLAATVRASAVAPTPVATPAAAPAPAKKAATK